MDFIQALPLEISELIIQHLNGEDVVSCSQVNKSWNRIFNQDRIWKLLCKKHGWIMQEGEDEEYKDWQELYWLNYNWRNGIYERHEKKVNERGDLQLNLDDELVIISHVFGTEVINYSKIEKNYQNIFWGDFHRRTIIDKNTIVIKLRDSILIYNRHKNSDFYTKVKMISTVKESIDYDPELNLDSAIIKTGSDRLVIVQNDNNNIKLLLWSTVDGLKYDSINLDRCVKHIFKTIMFNNKLYLLILKQNEYRIKVFDLSKEILNMTDYEITAFKNVAFGVIPPELQINCKFTVAFSPVHVDRDLCYGYSPLKVWDMNGKIVNSIILNSGRIDYFSFCLTNDLVIYRQSETTIKVWKPEEDKEISQFNVKPKIFKIDKCIDDVLVLSYGEYFDVWDFKAGTKLYTVETSQDNGCFIMDRTYCNKYYYVEQDRNKRLVVVFNFNKRIRNENKPFNANRFDETGIGGMLKSAQR